MTRIRAGEFPAAAITWLVPEAASELLVVGNPGRELLGLLVRAGHRLTIARAQPLPTQPPQPISAITVVAHPEALPFRSDSFAAILVTQDLAQLSPGLALPEFARVLHDHGILAAVDTVRDDTVPWVRRLAAILRRHDPTAMADTTGNGLALPPSPLFDPPQAREFRRWIPSTKPALLGSVANSGAAADLSPAEGDALQQEVAALYDSCARPPEPLLLPYTVRCVRTRVRTSASGLELNEITAALRISLLPPPGVDSGLG